ncbi:MAG: small basic protein [Planctomycetota bacterium]
MSLDSSLKIGGSVAGHRNVLTRAERVAKLAEAGEFDTQGDSPLGMRKVTNRKIVAGKKKKKKEAEE